MHVRRNGKMAINEADRKRFESALSDVTFLSEHCDANATKMLTTCVDAMGAVWDALYAKEPDDDE